MSKSSSQQTGARVKRIFHPTIQAPNLAEAEAWFERIFGRTSIPLTAMLPSTPNYPTEYSTFTIIQNVMLDTIDPSLHFVSGVQRYPSVSKPVLKTFGWYADEMADLYHHLRSHNIRCMDLWNKVVDGDEPPLSPGGDVIVYFTVGEDTGLQYQFMREGPYPIDDRTKPGWTLPAVQPDDALGVERCSRHTILTTNLQRALHFFVTALGGRVVGERRNELVGGASTLVALADDIFDFVKPDAASKGEALIAENGGKDVYYSMTWKVQDLGRAERHLRDNGVAIEKAIPGSFITVPETSLGIPWIFTEIDE